MAFFYFLTGGISLAPLNLTNLILQNSYVVIMALGMLLIIVAFYIDLSVGSVVGFVGGDGGDVHGRLPRAGPRHRREIAVGAGGPVGADARRLDRLRAGLFRRLREDSLVHRHPRRHADFPRPDRQHADGPVRRPVRPQLPGHQRRLPARRHRLSGVERAARRHAFPLGRDDHRRRRRGADDLPRPASLAPRARRADGDRAAGAVHRQNDDLFGADPVHHLPARQLQGPAGSADHHGAC